VIRAMNKRNTVRDLRDDRLTCFRTRWKKTHCPRQYWNWALNRHWCLYYAHGYLLSISRLCMIGNNNINTLTRNVNKQTDDALLTQAGRGKGEGLGVTWSEKIIYVWLIVIIILFAYDGQGIKNCKILVKLKISKKNISKNNRFLCTNWDNYWKNIFCKKMFSLSIYINIVPIRT